MVGAMEVYRHSRSLQPLDLASPSALPVRGQLIRTFKGAIKF